MRFLKRLVIGLVLLVAAFATVVALQPADYRLTRQTVIAAPAAAVFPYVNDLRQWDDWSPWAKLDPNAKISFEGPAAGSGAMFHWSGNDKIGAGTMTITESKPNERLRTRAFLIEAPQDRIYLLTATARVENYRAGTIDSAASTFEVGVWPQTAYVPGCQKPLGRVFRVHFRHNDPVFGPEQLLRAASGFGFLSVIDFLFQHPANFFKLPFERRPIFGKAHGKEQRAKISEIRVDGSRNPRILNLHRDALTGFQYGVMNLSQRCGRERLLVETGEDVLGIFAQLIADHLAQQREMHRRHIEMQSIQSFDDVFRKYGR